jgi:hypothetical protein
MEHKWNESSINMRKGLNYLNDTVIMKESDSWKIENILNYIYLLKIKQKGVI